jgi:hypothetical protein
MHFGPRGEISAADKRAADERSCAMQLRRAERLFEDIFWPAERVLLWIAFASFEDNFLGAMFEAKTYKPPSLIGAKAYKSAPLCDPNPNRALLQAVQDGSLPAIRSGAELPCTAWATATPRNWPVDVYFRREDVLRLWPVESKGSASPTTAPAK